MKQDKQNRVCAAGEDSNHRGAKTRGAKGLGGGDVRRDGGVKVL